jgi:AAA+ ATPase superfamily predicted ATPase
VDKHSNCAGLAHPRIRNLRSYLRPCSPWITNFIGLDRSLIGKYLNVLIDLGIIKREIPVTASIKSKKGIYLLRDNAFTFWFRFIFPFEDLIDTGYYAFDLEDFNSACK